MALDLAQEIASKTMEQKEQKKKVENIVLAIEDVRQWAADELGLKVHDWKIDKAATILNAMKEGGLLAATGPGGDNRRFDLASKRGRKIKSYVVSNFDVGLDGKWKDIEKHHRLPEDLGPF